MIFNSVDVRMSEPQNRYTVRPLADQYWSVTTVSPTPRPEVGRTTLRFEGGVLERSMSSLAGTDAALHDAMAVIYLAD